LKKALTLCFALTLIIIACTPRNTTANDRTAGKQTYDSYCANCHGTSGNGEGASAKWLTPRPRDFTACKLMRLYSDADLFKAIKDGGPAAYVSYNMAPWGAVLSDEQIGNVLAYERSFCAKQ
jgi:cytochrome c oxidase cbb3-type subunit III